MIPHQKYSVPFTIINIGKTSFEWYWFLQTEKISGLFDIILEKTGETLQAGESVQTQMTVIPLIRCNMKPHKISLRVSN